MTVQDEPRRGRRPPAFTIPDSPASSRASSPAPDLKLDEKYEGNGYDSAPGQHSSDVYDVTLPKWRAAIRRKIVERVQVESKVVAKIQDMVRRPWLDVYFVYTSLAGSHTFFMIMLPITSRALVIVLAAGVYLSSVLKDLFCAPRPFAPPVVRLTIGTFHLEYGFPSTHATNSVSIALFFFTIAYQVAYTPDPSIPALISPAAFNTITGLLIFYTFSIVFGRIYTGMHSFTDCVMGTILGAGIWWGHTSFPGLPLALSASNPLAVSLSTLGLGQFVGADQWVLHLGAGLGTGAIVDNWCRSAGWDVPLILIPICLLAVNQHPQPVDDCPCFEDAIAFGSVVLGAQLGLWSRFKFGTHLPVPSIMPGSGWARVLVIFVWRIVAKSTLHLVLPPTFRLLSKAFRLPNRRFYTPATEYKNVPSEFHVGEDGTIELHAIPSVIDLPSSAGVIEETGGIGSGTSGRSHQTGEKGEKVNGKAAHNEEEDRHYEKDEVKHYDADVLTKVTVYAGIAYLACEGLPWLFHWLGWGVNSSVRI
ncbi:hypothetical protein FA13DRAFT_1755388 [Coprinellus micaceus]|uniref:Phosphatidic acid phosphatase type 2/haloperoxidase domain-containing protein n=1 Tax=Coprinellus micaceus TaxID=71717 RepID=A0A4Y7T7A5_COPMI|nr:hypothetical protein FA13DRAFT_1755388 [Coprinellus micaceus]